MTDFEKIKKNMMAFFIFLAVTPVISLFTIFLALVAFLRLMNNSPDLAEIL